MTLTRGRIVGLGGLSLYLLVPALAAGMVSERVRFDRKRTAVLHRYDGAVREWHGFPMAAAERAEIQPAGAAPAQEVR